MSEDLKSRVEKVLDEKVRPMLARDGGSVELVSVDESAKEVSIRFTGACAGCPMSQLGTLNFIRETLTKEIPEIKEVRPA